MDPFLGSVLRWTMNCPALGQPRTLLRTGTGDPIGEPELNEPLQMSCCCQISIRGSAGQIVSQPASQPFCPFSSSSLALDKMYLQKIDDACTRSLARQPQLNSISLQLCLLALALVFARIPTSFPEHHQYIPSIFPIPNTFYYR